jgi:hypothetical protein
LLAAALLDGLFEQPASCTRFIDDRISVEDLMAANSFSSSCWSL